MLNYRIPMIGTILGMLLPKSLWQPLFFADTLAPIGSPVVPPPDPGATPPPNPAPPAPPPTPPESWRNNLSDDIKDHPSLANFNSVEDVAKSYLEANKMIGRKGIILPVEGATEEEIGKFYNQLGRPEKAEGYKIDDIELGKGVKFDDATRTSFLNASHKLGLLPHQVNGLVKWQAEGEAQKVADFEAENTAEMEASETKLRAEYGAAYDANKALAVKVVDAFGDETSKAALREGLGNDPRLIRMMVNIGKSLSEDSLGKGSSTLTFSPTEALEEIAKIRANKEHPHNVVTHPDHAAAVEQMTILYQQAYPDKK